MTQITPFSHIAQSDLVIDGIYEGDIIGTMASDPLSKLLPGCGNQGGFRAAGKGNDKKFVVLYTSGEDKDWPDSLNLNTGQFIYYGDNKTPGHELHGTSRGGNRILRYVFESLHSGDRSGIPPFFVFQKYPTKQSARSVQFKGLAVPGYPGISSTEDLIAVWKTTNQQRFQNYRSIFTILDVSVIKRNWIDDLASDQIFLQSAPKVWLNWIQNGSYKPLASEPTTIIRTQEEQTPDSAVKLNILRIIWHHFKDTPIAFEAFAAKIFQMHDQRVIIDEITRGTIDGGRDAIGRYILGLNDDPVYAEFSLEAKCYRPSIDGETANSIGVKEVSRLISRIRHRQFGVLVTTSVISRQAYEEVRTDRHPIIFISGKDIAEILIKNGYNTSIIVEKLLVNDFGI